MSESIHYSSKFRCKASVFDSFKASLLHVSTYRWQILLAIKKSIQATYQQDILGLFWSLLMPLIPMAVYMVLAEIKVFNTAENMPFIFYIALGMTTWLLMSTIVRNVMTSIKYDKSILTTTNYPIVATMLSQLGEVLHDTFIRFGAVFVIIVYFHVDVSVWGVVFAFLTLIPAIIISFSVGIIVALLDVVVQDTRRIVYIILRYGLFVSSVIFPFPTEGVFGFLIQFNFFNTYINAIRDFLYFGRYAFMDVLAYTTLFSVVLFLYALKMLYSMEYKIRAYL